MDSSANSVQASGKVRGRPTHYTVAVGTAGSHCSAQSRLCFIGNIFGRSQTWPKPPKTMSNVLVAVGLAGATCLAVSFAKALKVSRVLIDELFVSRIEIRIWNFFLGIDLCLVHLLFLVLYFPPVGGIWGSAGAGS